MHGSDSFVALHINARSLLTRRPIFCSTLVYQVNERNLGSCKPAPGVSAPSEPQDEIHYSLRLAVDHSGVTGRAGLHFIRRPTQFIIYANDVSPILAVVGSCHCFRKHHFARHTCVNTVDVTRNAATPYVALFFSFRKP